MKEVTFCLLSLSASSDWLSSWLDKEVNSGATVSPDRRPSCFSPFTTLSTADLSRAAEEPEFFGMSRTCDKREKSAAQFESRHD